MPVLTSTRVPCAPLRSLCCESAMLHNAPDEQENQSMAAWCIIAVVILSVLVAIKLILGGY
jgi:hypothetical protein